jgi:hypothetical protein
MRSVVGRCPMDVGGPRRPAQATSSGRAGGPRAPCTRRLVRARAQHVGRAPAAAPGCPGRSRESVCACPLAAQPPAPLPRSPAGAARRERAPPRAVPPGSGPGALRAPGPAPGAVPRCCGRARARPRPGAWRPARARAASRRCGAAAARLQRPSPCECAGGARDGLRSPRPPCLCCPCPVPRGAADMGGCRHALSGGACVRWRTVNSWQSRGPCVPAQGRRSGAGLQARG